MIMGVGVDVVDIARFTRAAERTPSLTERLFTATERERSITSQAGLFAAKEALIKALGGSGRMTWHEIEVQHSSEGAPRFELTGKALERMATKGVSQAHLSISHDANVALAVVIAEGGIAALSPDTVAEVMHQVVASVATGGHE
jgi:holo-[acyl-carrier protein] synthase